MENIERGVAAMTPRPHSQEAPVLICFDGSEGAQRAVDTAAALLGRRTAVVLNVVPPMTVAEGMVAAASPVPGQALEDLNRADAERSAEAGAAYARRAGLDAEPRAAMATSAWKGIVDVADEVDAALIVVGSRGLSGLREVGGGTVSHQVATHARRPVLIVPPPRQPASP